MKSYFLQVKDIIQETEEAITIQFWHPISEQIKYKAGQFITITIPDEHGKKIKRSYSMSSSPHTDTAVGVTVKRVKNGVVSNYLNDKVKKGDFLEVIEPMGNFFFEPEENQNRNIILVGAGSGITPLISIVKSVLKSEPRTKVFLLYGNRSEDTIIFKKTLEELCINYKGRLEITHILSQPNEYWVGQKGRINQGNATLILKDWCIDFKKDVFYNCGPVDMMNEIKKISEVYEIPREHFHIEKFNAPAVFDELDHEKHIEVKTQKVKINYDGSTYEFEVQPHQTILEAALDLDIDLPYSCQAGMCTACMGKCTSGKIKMDEEDGLTQKEIKEGFILTCVSHPLTDDVILEIN